MMISDKAYGGVKRFLRTASTNDSGDDNYTITTSVSIRVTPKNDHLISWGILWFLFVVASGFAAYQVHLERQQILRVRRSETDGDAPTISTADLTRSMVRTSGQ